MNVLIVEDEPFILDFFTSELRSNFPEHSFFTAKNGLEALKILNEVSISLVLTDGRMPKMDGIQLAYEIQKMETPPRVVMITGYVGSYPPEIFQKAKIERVFDKPVNFEELFEFIRNFT